MEEEKIENTQQITFISTPSNKDELVVDGNDQAKFGFCQNRGQYKNRKGDLIKNDYQEDTIVASMPNTNPYANFTPKEIGDCLKKSLAKLDQNAPKNPKNPNEPVGSTVSTTIWTGTHLVTATLGDAVAFIAVYRGNQVLGVTRLNSVIHSPDNKDEQKRIKAIDPSVIFRNGRMKKTVTDKDNNEDTQTIAITAAVGNNVPGWNNNGKPIISSVAKIDTTNLDKVCKKLGITKSPNLKFQVITTCDGFTEPAGKSKEDHEKYLLEKLKAISEPGNLDEKNLAKELADAAKTDGSTDNVSVAVITLDTNKPFLVGVFDGHGGNEVSHYLAHQICPTFYATCFIQHVKKFLKVTPVTPYQLSQINDQLDNILNVASSPKKKGEEQGGDEQVGDEQVGDEQVGDEQVGKIIKTVSEELKLLISPGSQSSQTWVQTFKNLADLFLSCFSGLGYKTFKDSDKEKREARFAEIEKLHEIVQQHHQKSPKEENDNREEKDSLPEAPGERM